MIIDIFSRKIVAWEVWEEENGYLAAELVERAILLEKVKGKPLVLHSDNGAPMKSYTLKSKLETLGVLSSYSRPRVSNDWIGYNKLYRIYNPKGKPFAMVTIKNMIHNKKYCGYNVRGQWESRNLFSENHSHCRTKKENWIVQKNDRIEPIVNEEAWNLAQEKVKLRLLHQNTGGTVERRDTLDKLICKCCGKNFYICHSKKIGSGINSYLYFICSTKNKQGKSVCDNDNVQVKKVDSFIEDLAKNYYRNIRLSNKAKLIKLQGELKQIKNRSVIEINDECEDIKSENIRNKEQLSKLIDNFLDCSDVMKKIVDKKINDLELTIQNNNNKILELERSKASMDADKVNVENKIKELKKELSKFDTVELTREELMDKIKYIKVDKGNTMIVEYT